MVIEVRNQNANDVIELPTEGSGDAITVAITDNYIVGAETSKVAVWNATTHVQVTFTINPPAGTTVSGPINARKTNTGLDIIFHGSTSGSSTRELWILKVPTSRLS